MPNGGALRRFVSCEEKILIRRTLMQRNQELVDFEADPATGEARIIDVVADDGLAASVGLTRQNGEWILSKLVERRAISPMRRDKDDVFAAFGAKSAVDLAFMGYGLSLSDLFWYRSPGSTARWEDINFFDNGWDPSFGSAVLSGDYASLATCSPDVPEATTSGHAIKAWERNDDGIFLIKAAEYPDGTELIGARLASDMCALLFDEGSYVPTSIVERCGRLCTSSPLMLGADEELADGYRLCAMTGMQDGPSSGKGGITVEACDARIDLYSALGIADASAHVAMMACFSCLTLLMDFNPSNFGAIHEIDSSVWRAAPIFDYDGSFGFPFNSASISEMCENPLLFKLFCAHRLSFLKPSWDWSWYDPQSLVDFEGRIVKAFAPYRSLPSNFAELIANVFVLQREYVNKVASGGEA